MKKIIVIILLLAIGALGCSSEVYITESQYSSVRKGMSKSQVLKSLGEPMGGPDGGIWLYQIKHEGYTDNVMIMFDEGCVFNISKQ